MGVELNRVQLDLIIGQGSLIAKGLGLNLHDFYWAGPLLDKVIIGGPIKKLYNFEK